MSKLSISHGSFSIEIEGDEDFLKSDAIQLIDEILELLPNIQPIESVDEDPKTSSSEEIGSLSAYTVATRFNPSNGPETVLAAIYYLEIEKRQDKVTRKEIAATCKNMKGYYNNSLLKNLTQSIDNLIKASKLVEIGTKQYVLSEVSKREMKEKMNKSS